MTEEADNELKLQSKRIAERVDSLGCTLDPITIATIIYYVVMAGIKCWQMYHPIQNADDAQRELRGLYNADPERTRRRLALVARREARHPISVSESFIIADAILDYACEDGNGQIVMMAVREVGQ